MQTAASVSNAASSATTVQTKSPGNQPSSTSRNRQVVQTPAQPVASSPEAAAFAKNFKPRSGAQTVVQQQTDYSDDEQNEIMDFKTYLSTTKVSNSAAKQFIDLIAKRCKNDIAVDPDSSVNIKLQVVLDGKKYEPVAIIAAKQKKFIIFGINGVMTNTTPNENSKSLFDLFAAVQADKGRLDNFTADYQTFALAVQITDSTNISVDDFDYTECKYTKCATTFNSSKGFDIITIEFKRA